MNVSLTRKLERFVRGEVASGRYRSASAFVRDCIRARIAAEEERKARLEAIRSGSRGAPRTEASGTGVPAAKVKDEAGPDRTANAHEAGPARSGNTCGETGRVSATHEPPSSDFLDRILGHRDEILRLADHYGVVRVRVIGPVARREISAPTRVDFLVDLGPDGTAVEQIGMQWDLEWILARRIVIVSERDLPVDELRELEREAVEL